MSEERKRGINTPYAHLEPFYGWPHIEGFSRIQLVRRSIELIDSLFHIDFYKKSIEEEHLLRLLDLLEIIKFGKDKFPYLLALDFQPEEYKLASVSMWSDPHYEKVELSVFNGTIISSPSLPDLKKDPKLLINKINSLQAIKDERLTIPNRICLGGTHDSMLVIGRPNSDYFKRKPKYLLKS